MTAGSLSAEVAAFLGANIDTIPQMETLLLLHEGRDRTWTAAQIAARIYLDPHEVSSLLRRLQQRRLVEVGGEQEEEGSFRYDARWDAHGVMEKVAVAYRSQLIAVTRFVHGKASPAVLDFARAFDLKKDR
jgi:hypothetical protein